MSNDRMDFETAFPDPNTTGRYRLVHDPVATDAFAIQRRAIDYYSKTTSLQTAPLIALSDPNRFPFESCSDRCSVRWITDHGFVPGALPSPRFQSPQRFIETAFADFHGLS